MAKWLEEGLEGMKAALDQAQWMATRSSDGHPSPLKQAYLSLREEVPYLDVGCVVALVLLLYLLWRLMLNAYKQRSKLSWPGDATKWDTGCECVVWCYAEPMVMNMCSAEEYERLGREYTMRQVAQLMKSKGTVDVKGPHRRTRNECVCP